MVPIGWGDLLCSFNIYHPMSENTTVYVLGQKQSGWISWWLKKGLANKSYLYK